MSAFRVGDRVQCKCDTNGCSVRGVVEDVGGATTGVRCDNGAVVDWATAALGLVAPAPTHATGDLVHPSGAKVEAGPVLSVTSGYPQWLTSGSNTFVTPNLDDLRRDMAELMTARADLIAARDEHLAMRAALDIVRKFLAGHNFGVCALSTQREMREVMGVVLRALNAERGDTW